MRFDWYQATIPAQPSHCVDEIIKRYDGDFDEVPPINSYQAGLEHDATGFRLFWGGHNPRPHLLATGGQAPVAAAFLKATYPAHTVSRADVCHDLDQEGAFDRLVGLLEPPIRERNVAVQHIGDPLEPELPIEKRRGRTAYYGSKSADVRLVIYEKGLKERSEGRTDASPHWVRVELRVRPRKRRAAAAGLSEAQFWGMAQWTRHLAGLLDLERPDYRPDPSHGRAKPAQAFASMLRQYGPTLRSYAQEVGRQAVLDAIAARIDADA